MRVPPMHLRNQGVLLQEVRVMRYLQRITILIFVCACILLGWTKYKLSLRDTVVEQDPTTLIDSKATGQLIDRLAAQADILIIDSPPCGRISDASIYQQYADSVLYVVQQDRVPRSEIAEAVEGLCNTGNKLLGYVLNGVPTVSMATENTVTVSTAAITASMATEDIAVTVNVTDTAGTQSDKIA